MKFNVVTLFPQLINSSFKAGVISRAISENKINIQCVNPRDFTTDKHQSVDDRPYGGGPGMVLRPDILGLAVEKIKISQPNTKVIALCPKGKQFNHKQAQRLSKLESVTLVCGRYEGFDERFISQRVDETLSIGDYVLSGGELAAAVVIDATARLLTDVLGHEASATSDSFATGLLDCPHYTRPKEFDGQRVPEILQNGHHDEIYDYRLINALGNSWTHKPSLFSQKKLGADELVALNTFLRREREKNFK